MSCRSRRPPLPPRPAAALQPPRAKRDASSDPPTRIAGFVHVSKDAHFVLVRIDEQLLQQRIARIVPDCLLEILLGFLDRREARTHLGACRCWQCSEAL